MRKVCQWESSSWEIVWWIRTGSWVTQTLREHQVPHAAAPRPDSHLRFPLNLRQKPPGLTFSVFHFTSSSGGKRVRMWFDRIWKPFMKEPSFKGLWIQALRSRVASPFSSVSPQKRSDKRDKTTTPQSETPPRLSWGAGEHLWRPCWHPFGLRKKPQATKNKEINGTRHLPSAL